MKKILALVLCVLMVFSVCGCGMGAKEKQEKYNNLVASINQLEVQAVNPSVYYAENGEVFLISDVLNKTNAEVKDVVITFAIWDENGNPLAIHTAENPTNTRNGLEVTLSNAVVPANSTWEAISGVSVSDDTKNVCYVTAFISEYSKDGVKVEDENLKTVYATWKEEFLDKEMEDPHYAAFTPNKKPE